MPPNLLFVTSDHQRADSIGMLQAGLEVTPRANAFAREAVRFERAYSTCPLCVPARTALATGLYPTRNGMVTNDWSGASAGPHTPLHQVLAEAGYAVAHVGMQHIRVNPPLDARVRFEPYLDHKDYERHLKDRGLRAWPPDDLAGFSKELSERQGEARVAASYSHVRTAPSPNANEDFKDVWFAGRAREALRRLAEGSRPFALFVNFWAPHPPLWVPRDRFGLFPPERIDLPADVGLVPRGEPANRRRGVAAQLGAGVSMAQWRAVWSAHLALTHLADEQFGRLLDTLNDSGRGGETAVVYQSDHGDHLGQRAMYQKMECYDPSIRTPLLMRLPGVAACRIADPVSHLHVVPTLLDVLGLEPPGALDAPSLLPDCRAGALRDPQPVFALYAGNSMRGDQRRMIVHGGWKYVYDPDAEPELFDLAADPLEQRNRASEPALTDRQGDLHARLAAWHSERGDTINF
ncbi:MAG: hypothetical protein AMXMBFR7_01230 [Planctomycetota bacterium]